MQLAAGKIARRAGLVAAASVGLAAVGYLGTVATSWLRYGRAVRATAPDTDPLLDRFMPVFDVADRHHIAVAAPAAVTFAAAGDVDLASSAIVSAIFKARELVLGATTPATPQPRGLLAQTKALGWGVLAEVPGREIVMGAVTQPWKADVVFRALPPDDFARFNDPGYVKIVWTLRADPVGAHASTFRTETRVATTDPGARARFRWYWARFSPGIILIRSMMQRTLKADAERRVAAAAGR